MRKYLFSLPFVFLFIITSGLGCNRDQIQGEKSLRGDWDIVLIHSTYGEFNQNTFSSSSSVEDSGLLGVFEFEDNSVAFNFTRNDTSNSGNGAWTLEREKVNEGFIRVNKFSLTIQNHFEFDVAFGDQTKNAEKNATKVVFTKNPTPDSPVSIMMTLEKR